jgi:hypothetical protein
MTGLSGRFSIWTKTEEWSANLISRWTSATLPA